ncbi:MAG: 4'-phosphopantetheinyl transferase [Spirosomataceae bacterium]|jgi:4'-phosphopantetheinyl transferase
MPERLFKTYNNGVSVLVWEIEESIDELLTQLPQSIVYDPVFTKIQVAHLRIEFLVGRLITGIICNFLSIDYQGIEKDIHGKPHLLNVAWEMSLTHSQSFVVVAIHPSKAIGIDIEKPNKKLKRIMPRLFTEAENQMVNDNLVMMSWFWSAKEALYKLYGKRGIDFKKHLLLNYSASEFSGEIILPDHKSSHHFLIEQIDDYYLVIAA